MSKINKIPHILFIVGVILVGFYGLILSVLAVFIQIFFILNFWKDKSIQRQTTKFRVGCATLLVALIFFGVGIYQFNSYFGGIEIIMWLGVGAIPFLISSAYLLSIPTAPKA